jgi:cyclophilin family peptidyl-prolyl cis-trans isomerase
MKIVYITTAVVAIVVIGYLFFGPMPDRSKPANIPDITLETPNKDITITTQPITETNNNQNNMNIATIETTMGTVVLELFREQAPKTVENFVKLAQSGFYDGTRFHRVIAGFMIQGGDPLTKDLSMAGRWGTGGPGYTFADEISASNRNLAGTIAMANAGPNTNGSQFFVNVADNNFLDTKHTVFGKVTLGMDVVKKIETAPTGAGDRPVTDVIVTKVTVSQ